MPDMTLTLDLLAEVRVMYGWSWFASLNFSRRPVTDERLWRVEKYLIDRLERYGLTAPPDQWNDDLAELTHHDIGGSD